MREHLFRGKRADNGKWVEGYYSELPTPSLGCMFMAGSDEYITCEDTSSYIIEIITKQHPCFSSANPMQVVELEKHEVIPETVGEFTGLADKNGKRIFEGDICQVFSMTEKGKVKQSFEICYGSYHDENSFAGELFLGFFGKGKLENEVVRFSLLEEGLVENCEIIGNIHDNKELLEVSE